jgi:hypothetical protein
VGLGRLVRQAAASARQLSFASLEDVVAWSRGRYRIVRNRIERFDEIPARRDDGAVTHIVCCLGTLSGERPGGDPFARIAGARSARRAVSCAGHGRAGSPASS